VDSILQLDGGIYLPKIKYDEQFKLEVVKAYLENSQGVRTMARLFGLPSKNYIHRWLKELTDKGLIEPEVIKAAEKSSNQPAIGKASKSNQLYPKTAREIQLEIEVLRLQAENDFLKKLKEIEGRGFPNR